ncbi:hypothetical protein WDW89_16420 [Deltaproteobacteria bacterium TL4]
MAHEPLSEMTDVFNQFIEEVKKIPGSQELALPAIEQLHPIRFQINEGLAEQKKRYLQNREVYKKFEPDNNIHAVTRLFPGFINNLQYQLTQKPALQTDNQLLRLLNPLSITWIIYWSRFNITQIQNALKFVIKNLLDGKEESLYEDDELIIHDKPGDLYSIIENDLQINHGNYFFPESEDPAICLENSFIAEGLINISCHYYFYFLKECNSPTISLNMYEMIKQNLINLMMYKTHIVKEKYRWSKLKQFKQSVDKLNHPYLRQKHFLEIENHCPFFVEFSLASPGSPAIQSLKKKIEEFDTFSPPNFVLFISLLLDCSNEVHLRKMFNEHILRSNSNRIFETASVLTAFYFDKLLRILKQTHNLAYIQNLFKDLSKNYPEQLLKLESFYETHPSQSKSVLDILEVLKTIIRERITERSLLLTGINNEKHQKINSQLETLHDLFKSIHNSEELQHLRPLYLKSLKNIMTPLPPEERFENFNREFTTIFELLQIPVDAATISFNSVHAFFSEFQTELFQNFESVIEPLEIIQLKQQVHTICQKQLEIIKQRVLVKGEIFTGGLEVFEAVEVEEDEAENVESKILALDLEDLLLRKIEFPLRENYAFIVDMGVFVRSNVLSQDKLKFLSLMLSKGLIRKGEYKILTDHIKTHPTQAQIAIYSGESIAYLRLINIVDPFINKYKVSGLIKNNPFQLSINQFLKLPLKEENNDRFFQHKKYLLLLVQQGRIPKHFAEKILRYGKLLPKRRIDTEIETEIDLWENQKFNEEHLTKAIRSLQKDIKSSPRPQGNA